MALPEYPNRFFSKVYNTNNAFPSFGYVWDPNATFTGNALQTGAWVPSSTGMYGGGGGAGGNVTVINTAPIPISGVVNATVTIGNIAVTGNSVTNSGTYSPNFALITGSQFIVPTSAKSWSVAIISGFAYLNGTGAIPAGITIAGGSYAGSQLLSSPMVVGATGSAAAPSQVLVVYET